MTEENIELLRKVYLAFARADRRAIRDLLAMDMEVRDRESQPDRSVYTGPEGFEKLIEANMEAFAELELEPEEFIDAGESSVVAALRQRVRGRQSGAEVECRVYHLWEVQAGKAVALEIFADREKALRAAEPAGRAEAGDRSTSVNER
jgi:ketosteroid isomerase-like protein